WVRDGAGGRAPRLGADRGREALARHLALPLLAVRRGRHRQAPQRPVSGMPAPRPRRRAARRGSPVDKSAARGIMRHRGGRPRACIPLSEDDMRDGRAWPFPLSRIAASGGRVLVAVLALAALVAAAAPAVAETRFVFANESPYDTLD